MLKKRSPKVKFVDLALTSQQLSSKYPNKSPRILIQLQIKKNYKCVEQSKINMREPDYGSAKKCDSIYLTSIPIFTCGCVDRALMALIIITFCIDFKQTLSYSVTDSASTGEQSFANVTAGT